MDFSVPVSYTHLDVYKRQAYEQLRTVEEELALERSLESGLITIGASETALRLMLLSRLEHFHTRYPHVRLRISNHSTPQAIQALENGLVDFAAVSYTHLDVYKRQSWRCGSF